MRMIGVELSSGLLGSEFLFLCCYVFMFSLFPFPLFFVLSLSLSLSLSLFLLEKKERRGLERVENYIDIDTKEKKSTHSTNNPQTRRSRPNARSSKPLLPPGQRTHSLPNPTLRRRNRASLRRSGRPSRRSRVHCRPRKGKV